MVEVGVDMPARYRRRGGALKWRMRIWRSWGPAARAPLWEMDGVCYMVGSETRVEEERRRGRRRAKIER